MLKKILFFSILFLSFAEKFFAQDIAAEGTAADSANLSQEKISEFAKPLQHRIKPSTIHPGRRGNLTPDETKMARIAWKYFENNYQPGTGLCNAVENYPAATMWDTGSYLAGLVAAYELGIIEKDIFDLRMKTIWRTLNTLEFFRDELPNKVYNAKTAAKVTYTNQPGENGFTAIDLGRFLIISKMIKSCYPEYADSVDKFILRWKFCNLLDKDGTMYGAAVIEGRTVYLQEGRLGYEEYAAKGFQLWGFNAERAAKVDPYATRTIYGIEIPYDTRDPRQFGAHNYVVTESYALDGIELNWDTGLDITSSDSVHSDKEISEFAQRIYHVQEERFKRTKILTARTEHQLDREPYFVYDAIFTDGYSWNTITEPGKYVPEFSAVALKGALGLWALWKTDYTDTLFATVSKAYDPDKGFYEGIYEKDGSYIKTFTANNNGIMLECLLYKVKGKLLCPTTFKEGMWEKYLYSQGKDDHCIRDRQMR